MENETVNLSCRPEPKPEQILGDGVVSTLVIICLSSLPVLTILGNLLVIIIIVRRSNFRQKANVFVVSLAIADIAVAIFVMLFSILQEVSNMAWLSDPNICLMAWSFDVMFTTTSILHLMCMTIDRYVAICLPFKYHDLISQTCVATLLMLCWSLPAVISFGLIFGKVHMIGIEEYYSCSSQCQFRVNAYYAVICSVISFYIPSIFMLVLNFKIFWNVRVRTRQLRQMTDGMAVQSKQKEHFLMREASVARTIAIMLGCFLICWLPFFVFNVIDPLMNYTISEVLWKIVTWFGYVNSTINPYLYYFRNRKNRPCIYKSNVMMKRSASCKGHQV
ncbi:5-hydroxytryptamine receptor 4-like [Mizuhopecten yessoensis]|uniref:5-hydroxytryptamine receptor 4-like n=1 Tax=Mizuhopecten yessoensis TaxID=6573 RepID=UPI000B458BF2|nr:5-hydroxytryptamine receptor 4-like [Mizuhopecten yessoensis]XP_021351032.1 5-hydroxytryptamine receptor 4-like [Mizuhopecten yessoensis]